MLRKLRAFLAKDLDFDDALTVEEYYLPVRTSGVAVEILEQGELPDVADISR